jgi:hypothetical protein
LRPIPAKKAAAPGYRIKYQSHMPELDKEVAVDELIHAG